MSQPASEHTLLYLWKFVGETPQELSFEDSMKIEASYKENPAKPVKLGSLILNLKNKTAYDATSNNCSRLERQCCTWSVLWNQRWRQLPWELNNLLSSTYYAKPTAVFEVKDLFGQPGTYSFNLINMTVTDVSHNNATLPLQLSAGAKTEMIDDFVPDFAALMAQGATEVQITVKEVRASFTTFKEREINMTRFDELVAAKPLDEVMLSKVYVSRPQITTRQSLGNSYSDGLYGWVWDKLMRGAVPTTGVPVQLNNISFVNNPSMMQRFRAAVEKLNVPNNWMSCPEASKLENVCSEHEFLFCLKTRVALMMHATDDCRERAILSCGFSMELNAEETAIAKGIAFTSNAEYAKGILANRFKTVGARVFEQGKGCIIFSWVAIGAPYFAYRQVLHRQGGCTTHFALTHCGLLQSLPIAALETPILVSFEPELCCPFAVAEFDVY